MLLSMPHINGCLRRDLNARWIGHPHAASIVGWKASRRWQGSRELVRQLDAARHALDSESRVEILIGHCSHRATYRPTQCEEKRGTEAPPPARSPLGWWE